jgi:hypothetical protein
MKRPVNQQSKDFLVSGVSEPCGLPNGDGQAYNHISQKDFWLFSAISHWERQDIGWIIPPSIFPV